MPDSKVIRRPKQKQSEQGYLRALNQRFQETFQIGASREVSVELITNRPKEPPFPTQIVLMNAIFDVLSIGASLLSLSGVGVFVYWVFKILTWVVNFFWFFGKESGALGRLAQKIILRNITLMLVLWAISDTIPFNDLITANTFLILSIHYHHKKVVKAFWFVIDEMEDFSPMKLEQ